MYTLTTTLFVLSASALLCQAVVVPSAKSNDGEENKSVNKVKGFSLQTGFEGYIASVKAQETQEPPTPKQPDFLNQVDTFVKSDLLTKLTILKSGLIKVKALLLPLAFKIFSGAKLLSIAALWGIVATHTVCKFTGLCSFSVNLPDINKEQIKEKIANIARPYVSEETLDYTLRLARSAIDNYNTVQEYI